MSPPVAAGYAAHLLRTLRLQPPAALRAPAEHPAEAWAGSGLMSLAGQADGPPQMCPAALASCADGALAALATLGAPGALGVLRGAALLSERAALMGLSRRGAVSPGGACRLYAAADGWIALNLARDEDRELLPAWLELEHIPGTDDLAQAIRSRSGRELVERGRLLGLAVAEDGLPGAGATPWYSVAVEGARRVQPLQRPPRVLDLSSLWAGPLCSHLLRMLGAEVIKLESPRRPDGARRGHPQFFDLLNAGKRSVAIDPTTADGLRQWRALIGSADIVIEGSRPRGLRQLGIDAEALVRATPGLTWISLSGYGRGEPQAQWVAYGDDAAVAAGLSGLMHRVTGQRLICGDAIADPLTGLHAALAAWSCHLQGGGRLIALALRDVTAHCLEFDRPASEAALLARQRAWTARAAGHACEPRARRAPEPARPLGADNAAVLSRWGIAC